MKTPMSTTHTTRTFDGLGQTRTWGAPQGRERLKVLCESYYDLTNERRRLNWTEHLRLNRKLGCGGQGVVYLSERRGADGFTLPVALKFFAPDPYPSEAAYEEAMERIGWVSSRVAQIAHDNLIDVQNWLERDGIRIMEMEWVDGFDLARLLTNRMYQLLEQRVKPLRWTYINAVIVTGGPIQPRLKPGVAVAIVRDCLAGLAALHRGRIVHGDIKPSNIMLKRTGTAKLVDVGSAVDLDNPPPSRGCTPLYAAPEVLESEGAEISPRSDLASLGYVLIEMLSGQPPFPPNLPRAQLLEAKRLLPQRLQTILPPECLASEALMSFCKMLIAPDPARRFSNAESADLDHNGAAVFLRQLVKGDLASEYANEIRHWLSDLNEL